MRLNLNVGVPAQRKEYFFHLTIEDNAYLADENRQTNRYYIMAKRMKNILILTVLMLTAATASGQRLVIGEKAPSVRVKEWLSPSQPTGGKPQLIEFFHSSNKQCPMRLAVLDDLAERYAGKLEVIIVAKEPLEKISDILQAADSYYFVGLDDGGRTFAGFGAQFVPFSVLVDKKGRVQWFGNPSSLDEETISGVL